jgi:hypothetical protein
MQSRVQRVDDRPNVFAVTVLSERGPDALRYLRFVFPTTKQFGVKFEGGSFESLDQWMRESGMRFENLYDNEKFTDSPAVVLYGRSVMQRGG